MPMVGVGVGVGFARRTAAVVPSGPSTRASITAIDAAGWSAQDGTPITYDPVASPQYVVALRQGFDATAQAVTHTDNLIITQRVRQAYPSQASLSANTVALQDYVYSTDNIVGVTNNSAEISPKPVAGWALSDHQMVGNTLHLEVVAFHRDARAREEIACVEFRATDGTTTVTQKVSTSTVAGRSTDASPVIVYACDLDISTLINPHSITVNAKVYPWIGGAASVLDSADSAVAREFSPRTYLRNTALAAAPVYAYVNSATGIDATGVVSTNAALAEASPCLTIAGAINRIHTLNASQDGCIIRLMAGTHVFSNTATTRTQTTGELVITRDPNTTKAAAIAQFGATAHIRLRLGAAGGWVRMLGITLSRQGTFGWQGESGSPLLLTFDDCNWDNNSHNAQPFGGTVASGNFLGVAFTLLGASVLNAGTNENRLFRGCTSTTASTTIEGWLVLGCTTALGTLTQGARSLNGAIIAYNIFTKILVQVMDIAAAEHITAGMAVVQNIFEFTSATSAAVFRISGDSATGNTTHLLLHHNTFAGFFTNGRVNIFYDEGATARTNKLMSMRGNIHVQINTKGDVFLTNGARVGNWGYLYGAGCYGEFAQFIDANNGGLGTSFAQAYPGLAAKIGTSNTVRQDPLFTAYAGVTSGPSAGAGGGTYTIGALSPAKAMLANPPLRFDLAGATRSLTAASAGAYE